MLACFLLLFCILTMVMCAAQLLRLRASEALELQPSRQAYVPQVGAWGETAQKLHTNQEAGMMACRALVSVHSCLCAQCRLALLVSQYDYLTVSSVENHAGVVKAA